MTDTDTIWFNGELRNHAECTVHVLSHALHYGSSVFEGIRAYETPNGTAVFRLSDHIRRLRYSADVYRIPLIYSDEVPIEKASRRICATCRLPPRWAS